MDIPGLASLCLLLHGGPNQMLLAENFRLTGRCRKRKDLTPVCGFTRHQGKAGHISGFVGFDQVGGAAPEVADEIHE